MEIVHQVMMIKQPKFGLPLAEKEMNGHATRSPTENGPVKLYASGVLQSNGDLTYK